ncbi:MAG: hypothetical protein VW057_07515 [Rhodospirillaceae bacterium]
MDAVQALCYAPGMVTTAKDLVQGERVMASLAMRRIIGISIETAAEIC